jgi:hypothetical protein
MTSPSSRDLSGIIGLIYDCALDPAQWDRALDALMRFLQCRRAELGLFDLVQDCFLTRKLIGIESDWLEGQPSRVPHAPREALLPKAWFRLSPSGPPGRTQG